jgi:hypothetical protein
MNHLQICSAVLDMADDDFQAAIFALEDGACLARLGLGEGDQEAVELAHADLVRTHNMMRNL